MPSTWATYERTTNALLILVEHVNTLNLSPTAKLSMGYWQRYRLISGFSPIWSMADIFWSSGCYGDRTTDSDSPWKMLLDDTLTICVASNFIFSIRWNHRNGHISSHRHASALRTSDSDSPRNSASGGVWYVPFGVAKYFTCNRNRQ